MSEGSFYAIGTALAFGVVAATGGVAGLLLGKKHPVVAGALGALAGATVVLATGRSHCSSKQVGTSAPPRALSRFP